MNIKCPVCEKIVNSESLQSYFDFNLSQNYELLHCKNCDVEFWTPLIMPPSEYYENNTSGEYGDMHFGESIKLRTYHKLFLKKFEGIYKKGRVLEIGCGDGRFLKEMQNIGWDITGIDFDKFSVENAKRKCNTNKIFNCDFDDFISNYYDGQGYDLIVFFEVLEHQSSPLEFLNNVKKVINIDGFVAGSVPNRKRYIVKHRFSPDNPPHHFTLWTPKVLKYFFSSKDFNIDKLYHTRFEPILLNQLINQYFSKEKLEIRKNIESRIIVKITFRLLKVDFIKMDI